MMTNAMVMVESVKTRKEDLWIAQVKATQVFVAVEQKEKKPNSKIHVALEVLIHGFNALICKETAQTI